MFPEEAYDSESSTLFFSKNRYLNSGIFLSGLIFLGPIIHELGHALVLELKNCGYNLDLGFSHFQGVHGSVEPVCHLNEPSLLSFYLAGFVAVLGLGLLSNLLFQRTKAWTIGSLTTGLYMSNLLVLGGHGDIYLASQALNLPEIFPSLFSLILVLAVSAPSLKIWEEMFNNS